MLINGVNCLAAAVVLVTTLGGVVRAENAIPDDLDARIAELEATVARKDHRNLSLQIYGQVNRALLYWKDGFNSAASVIDNTTSSTRLGFIGQGRIGPGLVAGYRVEFETNSMLPDELVLNGAAGVGKAVREDLSIRHLYWYLSDERLGSLSVGHQSPATDDLTIINLGSQMNDAAVHYNNDFGIWLKLGRGYITDLKWGQIAHNVDSQRGDFVRYDTPTMAGVVLSGAFGEDDVWDVAVRYQHDWNALRFAGGIGYLDDSPRHLREVKGSASLIHDPTGLYVSGAGGVRDDEISPLTANGPAHFYYLQLGISKQWLPFGKTTLYGDYGLYKNFNVGHLLQADLVNPGELVIWGTLSETEVVRWGGGIEQSFDDAGLLLYAQAHHYEATVVGFPCDVVPAPSPTACGGNPNNLTELPTKPWTGLVAGARIRF
jgi:hypothetical protein